MQTCAVNLSFSIFSKLDFCFLSPEKVNLISVYVYVYVCVFLCFFVGGISELGVIFFSFLFFNTLYIYFIFKF